MNNQPITVIVVLYYSKHLIAPLLKNITEKIANLKEIILVDNSGEDLSEFENSTVKVFHTPSNIGYGAAINFGTKKASNDLIIALNPDIEITEWQLPGDFTATSRIILSGKPNEWLTIRKFPSLTYDTLRLSLQNLAKPFKWISHLSERISIQNIDKAKTVDWISGALIITNKKTMAELNGFDEKYFLFFEEVDLCKRAAIAKIPRQILPTICFNLNLGTSSSINVSEIKCSSEIESAQRYHSKFSNKLLCSVFFFSLKIFSFSIAKVLHLLYQIRPSSKLEQKIKQYATYARTLSTNPLTAYRVNK